MKKIAIVMCTIALAAFSLVSCSKKNAPAKASAGKAGYVTVSPNSASGKYFYRVVSSHNAWYGSGSLSFSNLTTEAP